MTDCCHLLDAYLRFDRHRWSGLSGGTPLTLTTHQITALQGLNEPLSVDEVEKIYLPVARLLGLYNDAAASLYTATSTFLGESANRVPFVVAIAGSVAAGKSTMARVIKSLLESSSHNLKVELVATDGFLLPNNILTQKHLMEKKGFPESYDRRALLNFMAQIKSGKSQLSVPVYSHILYDIVPHQTQIVSSPDVLLLEGLNVLQVPPATDDGHARAHIGQYVDFSIYLDAPSQLLEKWYVDRFLLLRNTAFRNAKSYFRRYADLSDSEATATARRLWKHINLPNLEQNILPTKQQATAILSKGADHRVERIDLRKL